MSEYFSIAAKVFFASNISETRLYSEFLLSASLKSTKKKHNDRQETNIIASELYKNRRSWILIKKLHKRFFRVIFEELS